MWTDATVDLSTTITVETKNLKTNRIAILLDPTTKTLKTRPYFIAMLLSSTINVSRV